MRARTDPPGRNAEMRAAQLHIERALERRQQQQRQDAAAMTFGLALLAACLLAVGVLL